MTQKGRVAVLAEQRFYFNVMLTCANVHHPAQSEKDPVLLICDQIGAGLWEASEPMEPCPPPRSDGVFGRPAASLLQGRLLPGRVEPRGLQGGVGGLPDGRRRSAQHPNSWRADRCGAPAAGEPPPPPRPAFLPSCDTSCCRSCSPERWAGPEQPGASPMETSGSV